MKSLFVKAMTVKEFLSLTPKPENLYVRVGCSMEICEGNIKADNGFSRITGNVGSGGGMPVRWIGTESGASCMHENKFLYEKREKSNKAMNADRKKRGGL